MIYVSATACSVDAAALSSTKKLKKILLEAGKCGVNATKSEFICF